MAFCKKWILAAAALAVVAGPAQAEDISLAPRAEGNWVLDYADQRCRLMREFGEGDEVHLLMLDQFAPGSQVSVTLAGRRMRQFAGQRRVGFMVTPVYGEPVLFDTPHATLGDLGPALVLPGFALKAPEAGEDGLTRSFGTAGVPQIEAETFSPGSTLVVRRGSHSLTLQLSNFAAALRALNQCSLDLIASWGLDPERHSTMRRTAEPINYAEIAEEVARRYPYRARMAGEQAAVEMRIIVNADGTIASCDINDITSTQALRSPACDAFEGRAMFVPAQDATGEPIKSYFNATIVYTLAN